MAKYRVDFDVRHYNGSLDVEAESEEEALHIIENMDMQKLLDGCNDVAVEVEQVNTAC